ncbi:MAG TPA: daptide-type RiPP [Natronosporangium sp.]|nr:daptide-type RiPP [Natronosporangium sp.]
MKDVQLELPAPELELAMQELEPMEAPGFWTGFKDGVAISSAIVSAISASVAITT